MRNFSNPEFGILFTLSVKCLNYLRQSVGGVRDRPPSGFGLLSVLLAILAISLFATSATISVNWLFNEHATATTKERLSRIAAALGAEVGGPRDNAHRSYENDVSALP